MLAVPPAILDLMQLQPGTLVGLSVEGNRLIIQPQLQPRYTLAELIARGDSNAAMNEEERTWVNSPTVGREL